MAMKKFRPSESDEMQKMLGPGHIDQQVRQTIQMCWMTLPDNRKTMDEVEKQMRKIMERAFKDLREDADTFMPGNS